MEDIAIQNPKVNRSLQNYRHTVLKRKHGLQISGEYSPKQDETDGCYSCPSHIVIDIRYLSGVHNM